MTKDVPRRRLKKILTWVRRWFLVGGVSMIGYCGLVLGDSWVFQHGEERRFQQLLLAPALPAELPPLASEGLIGRMEIPRLGISVVVIEGTSTSTLRRAAGHISGTALPGRPGNVGISGHRDTFFRPLRNIRRDDVITLTTLLGEYRYRVVAISISTPGDVAVLNASRNEVLTLVTCYPFYFVGPAPDRFIVRAERIV